MSIRAAVSATTVTSGTGFYQFTGVRPGIYQVGQTQPFGYDSFGDIDGGDINIIGDVTPIELSPGEASEDNNFVETLDVWWFINHYESYCKEHGIKINPALYL